MFLRMFPVKIDKTDTCLTYALKRIGASKHLYTYENIDSGFEISPFISPEKLEKGDIVLWDRNAYKVEMYTEIDLDCNLTKNEIWVRLHFGVYEGNMMISDCSRRDSISSMPRLNLRNIYDIDRMPDKVLKYKHF